MQDLINTLAYMLKTCEHLEKEHPGDYDFANERAVLESAQKEIKLTANQLVLLLQIYRGTFNLNVEYRIGTLFTDIRHLAACKLVFYDAGYHCTALGDQRVRSACERTK